jgi:hypothetical protein
MGEKDLPIFTYSYKKIDAGAFVVCVKWLGRQGSNLRMAASKAAALPLGDAPASQ